jgi:hypothetical protein
MTNLAGETIDARCVDCVYIFIYIYVAEGYLTAEEFVH